MLRTPQSRWQDTFAGVPYQRGAGFRLTSLLGPILSKAIPFLQNHLLPSAAKHSFEAFMDLLDGRPLLPTLEDHVVNPLMHTVSRSMRQAGNGFRIGNMPKHKLAQHGGSLLPMGDDASLAIGLRKSVKRKKRAPRSMAKNRKQKSRSARRKQRKPVKSRKRKAQRSKANQKKRGRTQKYAKSTQKQQQLKALLANL